jgi:GNAT superfamily N-acetyltransferase
MEVHTLHPDAVDSAAPVIARAFHDDALTVYFFPDEEERSRLAPLMFDALVRYDCLFGQVDYLDGFSAVATWMRPGDTAETPERLAAAGFDDLPADMPLERLDAFFAAVAPLHARAVSDPHWYLRLLGVDPAQQGRGLGGALLGHGLKRAAAELRPCYLETFEERNGPFYLRHGFELVVDEVEPTSGVRIWGFVRDP